MTDYVNLVEYIVKNMVDHPDAVVVEAHQGRARSQTIEISLDPEDVGRVIGKSGRNIEAIRAVVKAAAIKDRERVNVEVLADDLPPSGDLDADDTVAPAEEVFEAPDEPASAGEEAAEAGDSAIEPEGPGGSSATEEPAAPAAEPASTSGDAPE